MKPLKNNTVLQNIKEGKYSLKQVLVLTSTPKDYCIFYSDKYRTTNDLVRTLADIAIFEPIIAANKVDIVNADLYQKTLISQN